MNSPPLNGLRARREAKGLTQAALAEVIGVNQSQLRKFETGAVRLDIHRAATLAERLGCSIGDLL